MLTGAKAVQLCVGPVSFDCIKFTEAVYQNYYKPIQAQENAVMSCRFNTQPSCMAYAFEKEKGRGLDERTAMESAGKICQGGVSKNCLELMGDFLLPKVFGENHDLWGEAINGCRRRP